MTNNFIPVQSHQLDSFKLHAHAFLRHLKKVDPSVNVSFSRKEHLLAEACGYKDHTDLIRIATGKIGRVNAPLLIFSPCIGEVVAERIAVVSIIKSESALKAIKLASNDLYTDSQHRWPTEIKVSRQTTLRKQTQYRNRALVETVERMRKSTQNPAIQKIIDNHNRTFRSSAMLQQIELARKVQTFAAFENEKITKAIEKSNSFVSKHDLGFKAIQNQFPAFKEIQKMQRFFKLFD